MRFRYSQEHIAFLRDGFKEMRVPELTEAFNARFGLALAPTQIKAALKNRKIKCGRKGGFNKGERSTYTREQHEFIAVNYPCMPLPDLTRAFNEKFGESRTKSQIRTFIKYHKIQCGRSGRFEPGNVPWSKGMKGKMKPNSGSFTKGSVPANLLPLGSERLDRDGYILVKVAESNPYTGAKTRFKHKHVAIWEAAHGPVPEGHVVRFLDGDKMNCVLENLDLFTQAESLAMTRLGFSEVTPEVKPTITAMAKLETKRFELGKETRK